MSIPSHHRAIRFGGLGISKYMKPSSSSGTDLHPSSGPRWQTFNIGHLNKTFYQIFCQLTGKHERPLFFLAVLINILRYTETFANRLAETLHSLCDSTTKVVFMCCPTAFVAFQHKKRLDNAMLLEYDQRFAVLSPKQFVPYDLDEPDIFPESLKGSIEIAVVDPPFLNEVNYITCLFKLY